MHRFVLPQSQNLGPLRKSRAQLFVPTPTSINPSNRIQDQLTFARTFGPTHFDKIIIQNALLDYSKLKTR